MPDPTVYDLLAQQIEGGFKRCDDNFGNVRRDLQRIESRGVEADIKIAVHHEQIRGLEQRLDVVSMLARTNESELDTLAKKVSSFIAGGAYKTVRQVLARDAALILATVGFVVAAFKLFGVIPR